MASLQIALREAQTGPANMKKTGNGETESNCAKILKNQNTNKNAGRPWTRSILKSKTG